MAISIANLVARLRARFMRKTRDSARSDPKPVVTESAEPVRLPSDVLPGLALDRQYGWYVTSSQWDGTDVQVMVSAETDVDATSALDVAHRLWTSQEHWNREVLRRAVTDLLATKNDLWITEGEVGASLTAEQFIGRMRLETIVTYPDGAFEFNFDDGGMFCGHMVLVSGDLENGAKSADIAG
jgi:hypothetical protein